MRGRNSTCDPYGFSLGENEKQIQFRRKIYTNINTKSTPEEFPTW